MSSSRPRIVVKLYRHRVNPDFEKLIADRVIERARDLDRQVRENGLAAADPADPLVAVGMETDETGRVVKNGYGVLSLAWRVAEHPEWPKMIEAEVADTRERLHAAHGLSLRYVIWAGMGGSAEDKAFYQSAGLLRRRVKVFILDSTDPTKAAAVLERLAKSEGSLEQALKRTLVVGMAMGMTSYEPVLNLEKLDELYRKLGIDPAANFIYLTLPESILDQFGRARGFRRIELQPDGENTTAGRHSGPLTRGSLYPLALNGCDLDGWMNAAVLNDDEARAALQLAGFIQANQREGRDKVVLHLPRQWSGGAVWTKQDFEESLGKSEEIGIKVIVDEKIKPVNYLPPKSERQDRCFVFVEVEGLNNPDAERITALRRAGYSIAAVRVRGEHPTARYMQFIHHAVFGLGWLRRMNFVTQPSVELYKDYARRYYDDARAAGSIEKTAAWKALTRSRRRLKWIGGVSVDFEWLVEAGLLRDEDLKVENGNAPAVLAEALGRLREEGTVEYGELTFFGDTRYDLDGARALKALRAAGETLFQSRLKMPVDVYEGPAMNHSYHETIIGWGRGFSIVVLPESFKKPPKIAYPPDYHRAQWLATQRALADRGRAVVGLTIRDSGEDGARVLKEFMAETARRVKRVRG